MCIQVRRSARQTNANPKYAHSDDLSDLEEEEEEEADSDNTEDDDTAGGKAALSSSSSSKKSKRPHPKGSSGGGRRGRKSQLVFQEQKIETLLGKKTKKQQETGQLQVFYLVKWYGRAYVHCTWELEETVLRFHNGTNHLTRFAKKAAWGKAYIDINDDYFNPDYTTIDRIIAVRKVLVAAEFAPAEALALAGPNGETPEEVEVTQYLVKWLSLQYGESTWENQLYLEEKGLEDEIQRFYKLADPPKAKTTPPAVYREKRPRNFVERKESPADFAHGHVLRSYQLEGMNWLCYNWHQGRNSILADEMGLGKTVQSVSLFHYLHTVQKIPGPFLVVAPLSTIAHWKREVEGWTGMHPLVYHGSGASRELIRKYEWDKFLPAGYEHGSSPSKPIPKTTRIPGRYRFNVLITTYEMILRDGQATGESGEKLGSISWACMVVDEAHRLKNKNSSLFKALQNFRLNHCVLLTGTPIQNKISELGTLLHFLERKRFSDIDAFELQFGDLKEKAQVDALHALLRPYLLRRMKGDVEKALPPPRGDAGRSPVDPGPEAVLQGDLRAKHRVSCVQDRVEAQPHEHRHAAEKVLQPPVSSRRGGGRHSHGGSS